MHAYTMDARSLSERLVKRLAKREIMAQHAVMRGCVSTSCFNSQDT